MFAVTSRSKGSHREMESSQTISGIEVRFGYKSNSIAIPPVDIKLVCRTYPYRNI